MKLTEICKLVEVNVSLSGSLKRRLTESRLDWWSVNYVCMSEFQLCSSSSLVSRRSLFGGVRENIWSLLPYLRGQRRNVGGVNEITDSVIIKKSPLIVTSDSVVFLIPFFHLLLT